MKRILCFVVLIFLLINLVGCSNSDTPDIEQIKSDLIGRSFISGYKSWQFASLSEFKELKITSEKRQGDVWELDTDIKVQDVNSSQSYDLDCKIVYKKSDGKWQIVSVNGQIN